ncbi:MAG: hypothetical protein RLZZ628_419 [Bacteroidota bacterium]|jgi:hypothetical protein
MKNLLIINLLCFLSGILSAQEPNKIDLKSPALSPEAAFTQQFGSSEIQVAYARPLARGRKIFGGLVPFDSIWRTGANDCTTLTFKEAVIIGNKIMPAGKYALFTIPSKDEWTIILNADTTLHGTNGYDMKKDLHRFKVKPAVLDSIYNTFTIEINHFTPEGNAFLNIIWDATMVRILLKSPALGGQLDDTTGIRLAESVVAPQQKVYLIADATPQSDIKRQFAFIFESYYRLKDALVADDSKLAAKEAKQLKDYFPELKTKTWTDIQRNLVESLYKKMEANAEYIANNSNKIEKQRSHLESLSKNLFEIAKALKINAKPVYWQYCPMANDNKGAYWLSKDNKVKNPYFGKSMLTCGSVKETLKGL